MLSSAERSCRQGGDLSTAITLQGGLGWWETWATEIQVRGRRFLPVRGGLRGLPEGGDSCRRDRGREGENKSFIQSRALLQEAIWANLEAAKRFGLYQMSSGELWDVGRREVTGSKQCFWELLSAHDGKTLHTIIAGSCKIKTAHWWREKRKSESVQLDHLENTDAFPVTMHFCW